MSHSDFEITLSDFLSLFEPLEDTLDVSWLQDARNTALWKGWAVECLLTDVVVLHVTGKKQDDFIIGYLNGEWSILHGSAKGYFSHYFHPLSSLLEDDQANSDTGIQVMSPDSTFEFCKEASWAIRRLLNYYSQAGN